jgi:hypothetical protein
VRNRVDSKSSIEYLRLGNCQEPFVAPIKSDV